ncbi:unnamed protein product [Closterium sp. Yama58-4]|nr:unnamed protein product [Closterium sp. Yama58-4]
MSPIRCHALEPNIPSKSVSVVGVISSCWSTLTPNNLLPGDIILALHPVSASPCPEDAAAHAVISRIDLSRIRQVRSLRRLVEMVAVGCAIGAFRGCTATLTVLRGTSKFIIAVEISPSALATECYSGCDFGAIQGSTGYCCGADGSFTGCFSIEWGLESKVASVGKENSAPPFSSADAFEEPRVESDKDEPLYRPLLVDFSRGWRQRRVGDMAAGGSVCQDAAAG